MNEQAVMTQNYVRKRIEKFQRSTNDAAVRRDLAVLRRGAGKAPGEYPEIFGILFDEFPEELMSRNGQPTREEWAAASSLCLYAIHQQGLSLNEESMNQEGCSFGKAVRRLVMDEDEMESVRRRFNQVLSASDIRACTYYLRTMIQLLRAKKIPLDYPQLALDLYWFQVPERRSRVQLSWGQGFYRTQSVDSQSAEEKGASL